VIGAFRERLAEACGRRIEAIALATLGGERGAVFTGEPEARILAAFGLAEALTRRGEKDALARLLRGDPTLGPSLDGLRILDPSCGGGALLAMAHRLASRCGGRLALLGIDRARIAVLATRVRLALLGAVVSLEQADALASPWPEHDLVLGNPPFLRHESLPGSEKRVAVLASGLSAQADLAAHFTAVAIRRAPLVAFVLPRGLTTARSAEPLFAEARARGGFAVRLSSAAAGSFAASVDTLLAIWAEGGEDRPAAEASVPLSELEDRELALLARGGASHRLRIARERSDPAAGAVTVGDVAQVRFGMKSGCNGFFHLTPLGKGRYRSPLAGEVRLEASDVRPLLAGLKEARAPALAEPRKVLLRPERPSAAAGGYLRLGQELGVHLRPTCAQRDPWWLVAKGRTPAPVLYPAKIGERAFAFLNDEGLLEDKKWHALFPRGIEPWLLALVLSSTPLRLEIDRRARQLTGAQAIADVDCRVLAAAPFPSVAALVRLAPELSRCHDALAVDPVSTRLAAMLDRPAQRALDALVCRALGSPEAAAKRARAELLERVASRLAKAAQVRSAVAAA
jgi:hypothetical protein